LGLCDGTFIQALEAVKIIALTGFGQDEEGEYPVKGRLAPLG